jgi:hypothetical protein
MNCGKEIKFHVQSGIILSHLSILSIKLIAMSIVLFNHHCNLVQYKNLSLYLNLNYEITPAVPA